MRTNLDAVHGPQKTRSWQQQVLLEQEAKGWVKSKTRGPDESGCGSKQASQLAAPLPWELPLCQPSRTLEVCSQQSINWEMPGRAKGEVTIFLKRKLS